MRKDIAPASYGTASVEELRGTAPSPDDILIVVKKCMADSDPIRVIVVCSAFEAQTLRQNFCQPWGVSERRRIGDKVKKNIAAKVGPCLRQDALNLQAAAYLTNWIGGTLTQRLRPDSYGYLRHRLWGGPVDNGDRWVAPGRERHIDLTCEGEGGIYFSGSEADDDEVDLALAD